ncbi:helix-turn-helix domain-containing protein [Burkholderia multivorans]|uniref:helix-turn-helix domain-containing protein n=1 Tax=Burkholderia multivorans TaxID=87883 RepID=UPI00075D02E8|nr:helix-turn-helix transcriptional regulator [Burkholderia multivorans]
MTDGPLDRNDACLASDLMRLRTQQGMSEQELADRIGRTAQCIRDYASGAVRPHLWTVHALNDELVGRNSWSMKVVDTPEGARPFFSVKNVPDDELAAEVQRRLLSGASE